MSMNRSDSISNLRIMPAMMRDAAFWIEKLALVKHPEGGYFRETYRSDGIIPVNALPAGFEGMRCYATAIYFLLHGDDFSAFHRIKSDELWHFYAGSSLIVHVIDKDGDYHQIKLGDNPDNGETLQAVVKAGCWFGACLSVPGSYALVGCTVAPGFDFRDFEMGDGKELIRHHPEHAAIIGKLTRSRSTRT
jgi:predicted cupin superfamily sugar epimerase